MTEKTNEEIADNIGKSGCWVEGCHYLSNPCPDCISRTQRIKKALDAKDAALLAVEKENGELKAALEWFIDWAIKDKEIKATADKAGWFVRALEMGRLRTNELISLKDELEKWHKLHDEFVETHDGGEPEPDFLEDVFSHIEQENYSLKAELEAARSESKRIVAIAGKELLAAQAQNERLVLALKTIIGDGFHCGACNSVDLAEKALKEKI